jgi:hypothetical protein
VVIASHTHEHRKHVEAASAAGLAIFFGKPLALSLEDADTALDAVAAAGVPLQVGLMRRFDPPYVRAGRQIEEGAIGRPLTFKAVSWRDAIYKRSDTLLHKGKYQVDQQAHQLLPHVVEMDAHPMFGLLAIARQDAFDNRFVFGIGTLNTPLHSQKPDTHAPPLLVEISDDADGALIGAHGKDGIVQFYVSLPPGLIVFGCGGLLHPLHDVSQGNPLIEGGLNGRTTVWDDSIEGYKNGLVTMIPQINSIV